MKGKFKVCVNPMAAGSLAFILEIEKECSISCISVGEYAVEGEEKTINDVIKRNPGIVTKTEPM